MHYSHEAAAGRAPGPPLGLTAGGRFKSAALAVAKGDDDNDNAIVDDAVNNMPEDGKVNDNDNNDDDNDNDNGCANDGRVVEALMEVTAVGVGGGVVNAKQSTGGGVALMRIASLTSADSMP